MTSRCKGSFFFSSRRRHTRLQGDWSSDVCSSDLRKNGTTTARVIASPVRKRLSGDQNVRPDCLRRFLSISRELRNCPSSERTTKEYKIGRASCRERV